MDSKDKYMKKVGCNWRYVRRVPKRYQGVDQRDYSTVSMKTRSVATARAIRDRLLEADDLYWASLLLSRFGELTRPL